MEGFARCKGLRPSQKTTAESILKRISNSSIIASLSDNGRIIACGRGVVEDEFVGLFDIIVDPEYRRKGYGTLIVRSILHRAAALGAKQSYLQVLKSNDIAVSLYRRLGYCEQSGYRYRSNFSG
jgi:ribosomal protein S18 acetylase RimI-like enzyme